MKIKKGNAGYIRRRKQFVIGKTAAEFGIVIALLLLGIWQTKSRMNWLTIVAVIGCLPAAKSMVEMIMLLPHHSMEKEKSDEIEEKTSLLTTAYDLVFTSEKEVMPVDCIVIAGNTICGYTSNPKTDITVTSKHIKQMLSANQYAKVSVKIFDHYKSFLTRAEGLNNIAAVEKTDNKDHENEIRQIILSISL